MKNIFKAIISSLLLILFFTSLSVAGNGKIAGVVKDNTGKPVPGATVMLVGTKLGGFADVEGRYFVLNIPPGKYDVTVSAVGYKKKTIKSVEVKSDLTTDLNVVIEEAAVEVEGVVIEAERKLVDKTLTSTRTTIGSDELSNTLPISSTFELLQTTPAVFKGFVRGGKQDQTKTIVEGVDISDEFYQMAADQTVQGTNTTYNSINRNAEGQQALSATINPNTVSELTVNTGAVGAEYVSASAGVINYSLKEGKGAIGGRAYFRMSAKELDYVGPRVYWDNPIYFAERDTLKAQGARGNAQSAQKASYYTFYEGKYQEGRRSIEGDLSLNGSITEDMGFFFSANLKDNPNSRLPNEKYRELNSQLKINYNLTPEIKLVALGILNDKGKLFGWKNSYYDDYFKWFLEGVPKGDGLSWVGSLRLTHFLSNNTFYEVQVYNKFDERRRGYCDDNNDGIIDIDEDGDFLTWADTAQVNRYMSSTDLTKFFAVSPRNEAINQTTTKGLNNQVYGLRRPGIFYQDMKVNVLTAKADFTSQVTFNHQLKAGLQFKLSEYDKVQRAAFIGGVGRNFVEEMWNKKPIEFGAYAQDRMEYAGLVINLGTRVDMWDPKAEDYADWFYPYREQSVYNELGQGPFKERVPARGKKVDAKWFFSPRIAVSHPISDKAAIYFSFARLVQPPPASLIYADYNEFANPSLPNVVTVDREPYKTTNYEFGGQWEIIPNIALNVNAYFRDIQNYSNYSFNVVPRSGYGVNYYVHFASGYANARGVEVQLETLPYDLANIVKLSGRLSYTYSYVKKSTPVGSWKDTPTQFTTLAGDSAKYGGQLPFDDYQYYRKVEINAGGSTSTLTGGFDREHRIAYTLFARFPYDITLTSLGTFQSGFYWAKRLTDPRIAGRELTTGPWNAQVDLRIEKAFKFTDKLRLALFCDIKNLFDKENILGFDATNSGYDLWELKGDPTGLAKRPVGQDGSLFYDIPREVYFSVTIDF